MHGKNPEIKPAAGNPDRYRGASGFFGRNKMGSSGETGREGGSPGKRKKEPARPWVLPEERSLSVPLPELQ